MSDTHFKKVNWLNNSNIYEVNIRQFTTEGTFNAFVKHLPRLKDMGVDILWIMPINTIAQKNKKGSLGSYYACSSYINVNTEFGNIEDFKSLVNEAHALEMKVILDWVANHTGWDHEWTMTNPEFYKIDFITNTFKAASGMDDIIELNFENFEMRTAMINAMKFWLNETNLDGFRCDLCYWVPFDFWYEARKVLDEKALLFYGEYEEIDHPNYTEVFDIAYSWKWMHESEQVVKGNKNVWDLKQLLWKYNLQPKALNSWFTSNHDENTWNGTEYEKYGKFALAFAVFGHTWNGIPLVYNGQEMPLKKRLAFFDKDEINFTENFELHQFYKKLNELRKTNFATHAFINEVSTCFIDTNYNDEILAYQRNHDNGQSIIVILNLSEKDLDIHLLDILKKGLFNNCFDDEKINFEIENSVFLKAGEFKLYAK